MFVVFGEVAVDGDLERDAAWRYLTALDARASHCD
jgi:uncharacterized protein (DUF427 family)